MVWEYTEAFTPNISHCLKCNAILNDDSNPPSEITIYTRNGTKFAQHFSKVCSNRAGCRIRYYCGYYSLNGDKVYYDLSVQGKYLITSANTAFAIDYLYEVSLLLLHGNMSFEALYIFNSKNCTN